MSKIFYRSKNAAFAQTKLGAILLLLILLAACLPLFTQWGDAPFVLRFASRVVILALAATALNLIMGFGGLVSFGQALFLGLGAYGVAIPSHLGFENGFLHLALVMLASGVVGAMTGMIALRTSGLGFIMISLAFAEMFYYLFVGMKNFGGDDGLSILAGSRFFAATLANQTFLYLMALAILLVALLACHLLKNARFGMVLRGAAMNKMRMASLGYDVRRYQILAYVIAAMVTGIAGMLYANLMLYAAPSYLAWPMSGNLIMMVVIGGLGTSIGPLLGAILLLLGEEILQRTTEHWMFWLGAMILALALSGKTGLIDVMTAWRAIWQKAPLRLGQPGK
ncbi:MAG: branched-chain amino acid ABC transporter permease [Candidatus Symbiobacter sp.]|nr:branched-chain amino acid ABC transporter permease [Candidatus Symbiobacter sp.]